MIITYVDEAIEIDERPLVEGSAKAIGNGWCIDSVLGGIYQNATLWTRVRGLEEYKQPSENSFTYVRRIINSADEINHDAGHLFVRKGQITLRFIKKESPKNSLDSSLIYYGSYRSEQSTEIKKRLKLKTLPKPNQVIFFS